MSRVLNLLLTHQSPPEVARMLAWWEQYTPLDQVLLAFNGEPDAFAAIAHPHKVKVDDPRVRTIKHSRERQSYTGVLQAAAAWWRGRDFTHLLFAEYDQLPLTPDFNARQLARLEAEHADVLAYELARVDGTNQPHLLNHTCLPGFAEYWASFSVRADKAAILSMLGCGSFWTRAAFDAVAQRAEPFPIYLELYLPTVAHHLGYRLRDWGTPQPYIRNQGNLVDLIESARRAGAWMIHPVKTLWSQPAA